MSSVLHEVRIKIRRPKLPSVVRIGAHNFRVVRKPAEKMGDENASCEVDKLLITVAKGLKFTVLQEKLLHEINHAAVSPALFYTTPKNNEEFEEAFVDTITPVQLQILQDNPKLVEFLAWKDPDPKPRSSKEPIPAKKPSE